MFLLNARFLTLSVSMVAGLTAAPAVTTAEGKVTGTVIFEGEAPDRAPPARVTDPYCAKIVKPLDDVVVTRGKLRDVVVRVKRSGGKPIAAPAAPVVIDQRDCAYEPRVVTLIAGQKLVVRNSDGTFHNVRGMLSGKPLWNKPQPAKDPDLALDPSAAKPGDVVELACDVHPWMHAYVVIVDHPFVAVTGADGKFEIGGLAPGSYTLEAWHPTLGTRSIDVQIGTGGKASVTARLSYK